MRAWVIAVGLSLLKSAGNLIFYKLWANVVEVIIYLEQEFSEPKSGMIRKAEFMEEVMKILKTHNIGNWSNRWIIKYLVELSLESSILLINERIGHCWVTEAERVRDLLRDKIFFIR